jgi:aminoglycoside phosphotransferase (APT) family kinase protein
VPEWSAEVTVDEHLARRLIADQFRDVALESLTLLGEGWDNTVWLADGRWVFRFPRRALAIPGVEREIAALRTLAPRLPLPIPEPVFVGTPTDEFPWPWFGAPHVAGGEPLGLSVDVRSRLARPFGEFLRALHNADIDGLPADPFGRADMSRRVPQTREWLGRLEAAGLWRAPPSVAGVLTTAEHLAPPSATVVVHGDLHFRHVMVDASGTLSGVIDWGDLCRSDPAVDMSLVWSLLPDRHEFLAAYGPVSEEQLLRARVLALFLCAAIALSAHDQGQHALASEALAGLERTAAG